VVAGLCAFGLLAAASRAAGSAPAQSFAMAVVDRSGNNVISVTETVSQPGRGVFAVWPGAFDASVPAGLAALVQDTFTVPQGVGSAQVKYFVRMPQSGLTLRWPFPTRVGMLWILVGKGLSMPPILNQRLTAQPPTVWNGSDYAVYSAKGVSQDLLLNLQYQQPAESFWQRVLPWLWLLPVAVAAVLVLRRLVLRAHA
jgi:hypothetical protein